MSEVTLALVWWEVVEQLTIVSLNNVNQPISLAIFAAKPKFLSA